MLNIENLKDFKDGRSIDNPSKEMIALLDSVHRKGYVIRHVGEWLPNDFGQTDIVVIENGRDRISFVTNVLHGRNYFKIHQVHNYFTLVTYKAERYHKKYVSMISDINGNTFIKLNK